MSWRTGCEPWPPVGDGAERVRFDFAAADHVGLRLDGLRRAVDADLQARAAATPSLVDWAGGRREEFDAHRSAQEAIAGGGGLATLLGHLRAAWDEAARAQRAANRVAADAAPPPGAS
jgi:hypothetical protein